MSVTVSKLGAEERHVTRYFTEKGAMSRPIQTLLHQLQLQWRCVFTVTNTYTVTHTHTHTRAINNVIQLLRHRRAQTPVSLFGCF